MLDSPTLPQCCQLEHSVNKVWIIGLDNESHSKVSSVSSTDRMSLYKHLTKLSKSVADNSFGAFAKLRKPTISFMSFRVRMEQLGSHTTDFHEI